MVHAQLCICAQSDCKRPDAGIIDAWDAWESPRHDRVLPAHRPHCRQGYVEQAPPMLEALALWWRSPLFPPAQLEGGSASTQLTSLQGILMREWQVPTQWQEQK